MFRFPSERTRQIHQRLESWERLRAQRARENFAADSCGELPSGKQPQNSDAKCHGCWLESSEAVESSTPGAST